MSCYEWEEGTIKLPSAEFSKVFGAVLNAAKARNQRIFAECDRFWKWIPPKAKRDHDTYRKYVIAFVFGNQPDQTWDYKPDLPTVRGIAPTDNTWHSIAEDVRWVLDFFGTCEKVVVDKGYGPIQTTELLPKPRRVTKALVEKAFPATNRTTYFSCGEPSIRFDRAKRTVTWSVPENNHAREHGREHELAEVLFKALGRVSWTRGSGGVIIGNDEYNRDSMDVGGGGNYVIDEYGPNVKTAASLRRQALGVSW